MDELAKASKELIEFIDENDIKDEAAYDNECPDEWRSGRFQQLINNVKEALKERSQ